MPGQSLLDGIDPVDPPVDPQNPSPDPVDDNPPEEPSDEIVLPQTEEELQQRIDEALSAAASQPKEGVPATAEEYTIPEIDGIAADEISSSTVFQTIRSAAHEAGVPQEAFNKLVTDWHAAEVAEVETYRTEQLALLGQDEEKVKLRLGTLSASLTRLLPEAEAKELMGAAASAGVVQALERLINRAPAPRSPVQQPEKDDESTIKKLMNSPEYMGLEHERDPEVVARVDRYFAGGGTVNF